MRYTKHCTQSARVTPDDSRCSTAPLSFFAHRLHLATFAECSQPLLFAHFVAHYTAAGVLAERMHFFLDHTNEAAPWTNKSRQILLENGVSEQHIQVVARDASFTDRAKLHSINSLIRSLPLDHWMIAPDLDEHFGFPCDLEQRAQRHEFFCGMMYDRLASDGRIHAVRATPPLSEQFPLPCYVRQHLRQTVGKVMLMRVGTRFWARNVSLAAATMKATPGRKEVVHYFADAQGLRQAEPAIARHGRPALIFVGDTLLRQFSTAHRTFQQKTPRGRCEELAPFAHYSLTLGAVKSTRHKMEMNNKYLEAGYLSMHNWLKRHVTADARNSSYCRPCTRE